MRPGETYLVGPDGLMRSDSRLFLEDPQAYKRAVVQAGTPPDVADRAIRLGGTTLVQPVASEATRAADRGQSGTLITTDYLGHESLQAYAPLVIPDSDIHWSIVAKLDTSEAFAREAVFTKTMVLSTVGIIFIVCIAAIFLAQLFVRPIRRLEAAARRISAGDYHVVIPVESRDEIGDLTKAFNEMSRNLTVKEDLLNEQRKENDQLLGLLMPEPVVARYREGEEIIAQEHQDVTVIFADVVGLDRLQAELTSERWLTIVDELVRQFDAAGDGLGIERIRSVRNGYLASCGLNVPRLDNVRRTVDFALEMSTDHRPVQQRDQQQSHPARGHRHRHGQQRTQRSALGGLRHVGCGSEHRLSGEKRFPPTWYRRHRSGVRSDPGHHELHICRFRHGRRAGPADLATGGAAMSRVRR